MVDGPGVIVKDVIYKEIESIKKKKKELPELSEANSKQRFLINTYSLQICELECIRRKLLRAFKKETVVSQNNTVS